MSFYPTHILILSGTLPDIYSGILSGIPILWILTVEVRQGTLGVDTRGWGPAGNTGRGWSWLRSGREHLAWILAVEVRQGREERGEERRGEERRGEEATNLKSNNPHLAGGEKRNYFLRLIPIMAIYLTYHLTFSDILYLWSPIWHSIGHLICHSLRHSIWLLHALRSCRHLAICTLHISPLALRLPSWSDILYVMCSSNSFVFLFLFLSVPLFRGPPLIKSRGHHLVAAGKSQISSLRTLL